MVASPCPVSWTVAGRLTLSKYLRRDAVHVYVSTSARREECRVSWEYKLEPGVVLGEKDFPEEVTRRMTRNWPGEEAGVRVQAEERARRGFFIGCDGRWPFSPAG